MSRLTVDFVSPVEFDNLAAEVCYDGQVLCRIKSERADKELEIEFYVVLREPLSEVSLPLQEFLRAVVEVSDEVKQLRAKM